MKNKSTIFVVCFTGNSGLTDYSVSLAREISKRAEVTLITAKSFPAERDDGSFPVVRQFRRTRHYLFDFPLFVIRVLQERPAIVLFQSWIKYPLIEGLAISLFRLFGISTAITIHDLLPHYPKPWSKWLHGWYYRRFDRLIVHSAKTAEALAEMVEVSNPLVVPHGVYDIFRTRSLSRSEALKAFQQIDQDDFVVLYFGHIETRKGILEFLSASEILAKTCKAKFVVAGRNDLGSATSERHTFEYFRGRDNVILHDEMVPFDAVQNYFAIADVVALPYLEGTTSGVMKLAMAFGKPVIVSDVGDLKETLVDWPGLVIPPGLVAEGLVGCIERIRVEYDDFLAKAGRCADKYSWATIGQQYLTYLIGDKSVDRAVTAKGAIN